VHANFENIFAEQCVKQGSQPGPSASLEGHGAVLRGHEQRLLLNSSAVILQNPSATILIIGQLKGQGVTNHVRLRTTGVEAFAPFMFA